MAFGSGQSTPPQGTYTASAPGGKGQMLGPSAPSSKLPTPGQSSVPPQGGKGTTTATAGYPGMPPKPGAQVPTGLKGNMISQIQAKQQGPYAPNIGQPQVQQPYNPNPMVDNNYANFPGAQVPQALPAQGKGAVGQVPSYATPYMQDMANQPQVQQPYGGFPQTALGGLGQPFPGLQPDFFNRYANPNIADYPQQIGTPPPGMLPAGAGGQPFPPGLVQESNMYRPPVDMAAPPKLNPPALPQNPQVLPANPLVQPPAPPQRRDMDEDHRGRFNQMNEDHRGRFNQMDDDPRNRFNQRHMDHEKERMMRRNRMQGQGLAGLGQTRNGPPLTPEQIRAMQ